MKNWKEQIFYEAKGFPIAYTEDDIHIYLYSGEAVAYIEEDSVYSYSGQHLGWFIDGWILDNEGRCVFFTDDAIGSPIQPIKKPHPLKEAKESASPKETKEMKPLRPLRTHAWSSLSFIEFFKLIK